MKTSIKVLTVLIIVAMLCVAALSMVACDQQTPAQSGEQSGEQGGSQSGSQGGEQGGSQGSNQGGTSGEPGDVTTVVTDMVGRELTVKPASYSRIVCIGAGALRMYCYLGDVDNLAGVEDIENKSLAGHPAMFDDVAIPYSLAYADDFSALPSCGVGGPNAQYAEAEKILLCNPDLVISEYEDADKANALQEQLGVPVVTVSYGSKGVFDERARTSLTLLGKVLGKEDKATTLCNYILAQKAELEARTADVQDGPSVYICGLGNWGKTNHLMTAQNYEPFNVLNINNAVTDLAKDGIQAIEAEKLVDLGEDIDIMIIDAAAIKNILPLYGNDPTMFDTIKAWQEGEVYLEMAYNAYYTNLEIALINTWYYGKVVYPDLFEDVDIDAKMSEVTLAFLGQDLTEAIKACGSSYGGYQKIDVATFFN